MSICKKVAVSAQCSFILTMAEMPSLAIQKAVKGKLLNVEVAVLALSCAFVNICAPTFGRHYTAF